MAHYGILSGESVLAGLDWDTLTNPGGIDWDALLVPGPDLTGAQDDDLGAILAAILAERDALLAGLFAGDDDARLNLPHRGRPRATGPGLALVDLGYKMPVLRPSKR